MGKKSGLQVWGEYALARSVLAVLGVLPRSLAMGFGFLVARLGYVVLGKLRRVGVRSLELAFPEKSEKDRTELLKASFRNLGRTMGIVGGFTRLSRKDVEELIETAFDAEFEAEFEKIRREERGLIVLTGHLGNWELFAFAYSVLFGPSNLLSRRMDNPEIDQLVKGIRSRFGNREIDKVNSAGPILRILRSGGSVGILADVNTHPKEGVFVPFFGIEACTTAGVAMLASRADALIVPLFAVWDESKGKYLMVNEKIIRPANTGDRKKDIETTTADFTAAIERVVRRYPDQWLWIHRRWKTRPPGEPELYLD